MPKVRISSSSNIFAGADPAHTLIRLAFLLATLCCQPVSADNYLSTLLYVKDGKICLPRLTSTIPKCREPDSPEELAFVRQRDMQIRRYMYLEKKCDFSMFRSWDSEIDRLRKLLNREKESIPLAQEEIRWAKRDIKKPYLHSDDIRGAYDVIDMSKDWIRESREKIEELSWCLDCAQKRKDGAITCRPIEGTWWRTQENRPD